MVIKTHVGGGYSIPERPAMEAGQADMSPSSKSPDLRRSLMDSPHSTPMVLSDPEDQRMSEAHAILLPIHAAGQPDLCIQWTIPPLLRRAMEWTEPPLFFPNTPQ